jgi:hypothetical protein
MSSNKNEGNIFIKQQAISSSGYLFNPDDEYWQLDKNTKIPVGSLRGLLEEETEKGFFNTLIFYAANLSAAHVQNIFFRFLHFLRSVSGTQITDSMLISYRAALTVDTEW